VSLCVARTSLDVANEWDAFVRAQTGWTPYHLHGWRRVLEDVHGHECVYLGARDGGGPLRGVLPLVRVKSALFGHYLVSMPFLNYGGPLGDPDAVTALAKDAVRLADEGGVELLELRAASELPVDLEPSHRKITVLLDLPTGTSEGLWDGLPAKLRSQVRRPMKEKVEVRFGADQLDGFYAVFARHMRDLGTPVMSKAHFRVARDVLGDTMWFACAYLADTPVAAGSGFRWGDRFELVWASSLREHNRIAPNMLLYWRFMERCIEDGARVFDFGRCTPGGGTHRFKAQWGGRDEPLWWYQHGRKAGGGTPSPDKGALSYAPRVWSRLPLALANTLGPRIVKYIP
jgi:serine/alanine adding enzyme